MYARSNGIHRTKDGGETWTPSLSTLGGYFLALDPADHRRIWAGDGAGINSRGSGLHYSDNGARTFRSVPSVTQTIYSILFDQRRPGSIYGGSYDRIVTFTYPQAVGGSIFVSRDNGATFTKGATHFGSRVVSMAADPFEDILYAATDSRGVFRSLDGGTTWEAAGAGGILLFTNLLKIIADPVRRGRLYASTTNGVFRSTDAARTWEHMGLYTAGGLHVYADGELVITPDGRWLYAGTNGGVFQLDLEKPTAPPAEAASFFTLTPCRLVDTRGVQGSTGGPALQAGAIRAFPALGCSVPASARAISVNVTVVQPTSGGHLSVFPSGAAIPSSSTINYAVHQTRAVNVIILLNSFGDFDALCGQASGTTHLIVDVNGYFK
jgi:hypothetical protein